MISSATHGPISVAIHAMFPEFQHYASGVFTAPCPADETDHSVLLVGYDKEYWIVKNSFGTGWGEEGYIRIARSNGNVVYNGGKGQCGILQFPSLPIVSQ